MTYIRVKPPELSPGVWPILASVTDAGVGKLTVTWTTGHLAVGVAHPVVLFRTFALIEVTGRETVANTVEQRANTAYAQ